MSVVRSNAKIPKPSSAPFHPVIRFLQKSVPRPRSHIVFTSSKRTGPTTRFSETFLKGTVSRAFVCSPNRLLQIITPWPRNSYCWITSTSMEKSAPMVTNGRWELTPATTSNEPGRSVTEVIVGFHILRKEHWKLLAPSVAIFGIVPQKQVSAIVAMANLRKMERLLLIQESQSSRPLRDILIPCFAAMISTIPTYFVPSVS